MNQGPQISKEDLKKMDEAIMESFLNAVKISIDFRNDIPIEPGKLWLEHMVPCRGPDFDTIDLKLSSYKKMGKFVTTLRKQGLI